MSGSLILNRYNLLTSTYYPYNGKWSYLALPFSFPYSFSLFGGGEMGVKLFLLLEYKMFTYYFSSHVPTIVLVLTLQSNLLYAPSVLFQNLSVMSWLKYIHSLLHPRGWKLFFGVRGEKFLDITIVCNFLGDSNI